MKKEYKIGLTFIICILMCFAIINWVSNGGVYSRNLKNVKVFFDDIGGLGPGDPVFIYGLKKGRVSSFKLHPKGVEVNLGIDGDVDIYMDGYAAINMKEIMGGKKIDLYPGTDYYDAADSIRGISSMDISQVMSKFGRVFADMSDQNMSFTIASFSNLSLKLAMIIESINPKNLRQTMDGVDMIIADINKEKVVENVAVTIKNYNSIAVRLNKFLDIVDSLPQQSEKTFAEINKLLKETDKTLDMAKEGLTSMKSVMDNLLDKKTLAGKFLTDKTLTVKLDSLMKNVDKALEVVGKNQMVVGVRLGKGK